LLAYTFSAFVGASIVYEFVRGTRARHALTHESWPGAFASLIGRNRRRYGGYVVHAAVLLLAIGVAGSSAYQTVRERRLAPGQTLRAAGYAFTYTGVTQGRTANARTLRAHVDVRRGDELIARLDPGKNVYPVEQQTSNEVSINHDWRTLGDEYTILDQVDRDGSIYLKVLVKPLVNLLWLAGFVFVAGSVIALWPDPAEQRRLQERYAPAAVEV
jgi:cytochrome c-type biogenesis protein CcmF